jgi:FAD/FMN-containing dehydrogenase
VVTITDTGLEGLRRDFGGDIITPDTAQYAAAGRALFAAGSPVVVLRPRNVPDVQAGVRFARAAGLGLAVRGGGHGFPGFGTVDGGVVIDLCRLASVEVLDERQGLVRIGGGATWGQVAACLAVRGLAISSGDTKSVGVGGLTLTGGIGWKVRKYGLALDNVIAADVVLASGEMVTASATDNPLLYWAIRGGGGNFGIVTAFEFAAHRTTDIFFGKITFPATESVSVLPGWANYLRHAPEELTSVVNLAGPTAGGRQAPLEIYVAFDGDAATVADDALAPIRALGTVIQDDVALTAYADVLADGAVPPPGIHVVTRSAFVDTTSVSDVLRIITEVTSSEQSPLVSLRSVGGAVSRLPADATAYAYRGAELMLMTLTVGPKPLVEAAKPALEAVWARLAPHVTGAYANFLSTATDDDVAAVYPEATASRLSAVKRVYDPENLFAANHNIRPARFRPDAGASHPGMIMNGRTGHGGERVHDQPVRA